MADDLALLFGDIHNHNALGYGVGSLERSIDVARTHLDFFAFTGHSSWHDIEPMEGGREQHWLRGFARLQDGWPRVQALIADANNDAAFTAFLGFEWHSSRFGDQCVVFPEDHRPLAYPDRIEALRSFCRAENALMIPHHLAYPSGRRGVDWDVFDPACTPVVEVYSEHGNSEDDRGPLTFFNHSLGGRQTSNTARTGLDRGLRFGFVASSDNHSGFPGAYGEGIMAVLARGRDRASILEAISARRTYALTGDRMEVDFAVEGAAMGEEITAGGTAEVAYTVAGRDELDIVEVIQDGRIVHRSFPEPAVPLAATTSEPFQVRLEWGWGPWGDLALERIADWEIVARLTEGRLLRHFPCLQSGPFDEDRRHRFEQKGDRELNIRSYTSRRGAYRQNPNQSVVMELIGGPQTEIAVEVRQPAAAKTTTTVAALHGGSANHFVGPFPQEAFQLHRIVPLKASRITDRCVLSVPQGRSYVYLRVRQQNGHLAWVSPVFMNYR